MTASIKNRSISFGNATLAYLLAVTVAAITFSALLTGTEIISSWWLEITTINYRSAGLQNLLNNALIAFCCGWVVAFFAALLPFTAGIFVINKLKAYHWRNFVGGAAFTAAALYMLLKILSVTKTIHKY